MATEEAAIKRVISQPNQSTQDEKKLRMSNVSLIASGPPTPINGGEKEATDAVAQLNIIENENNNDGDGENIIITSSSNDDDESGAPPDYIGDVNVSRRTSDAESESSLSDNEPDADAEPPSTPTKESTKVRVSGTLNVPQQTTPSPNRPPKSPGNTSAQNMEHNNALMNLLARQVSKDNSLNSRSSGGTGMGKSGSVGNWGWFEDVHGHESAFLPGVSANGNVSRDNSGRGRRGGQDAKGGATRRKGSGGGGGLLHIGSELLSNVIQSIVEPQRREANTMAVTAPTYVLEESLSSQKLWKHTAGNRPPQPVEERAFFEQMWAQNFTRSKVKYEIPAEVLTASTPISISPFNDFGEDGVTGPGGNLSNYNLAAPFNMKSGDEHPGTADPASVKAAQADVAEATLNQHLSNGAVEMYFDPNRPKDYNLNTLGPHVHHHTLVNKKVKCAGEDNDEMTVVVRGDNVFGTTVSKSFPRVNHRGEQVNGIDTVSISIASYRVVESKKHGKYAQYLVIFCDGNFRNTVGVWKRYSDFSELSRKVASGHSADSCAAVVTGLNPLSPANDDHDVEILPNAITSWRLLKKRQRWYRCLDAGYLSLKVFLLERFLHDILFESSNPQILRDFVADRASEGSKLNMKG